MNNRSQIVIYGFMLGLTILIFALALAPSVKETISNVRNQTYSVGYNGSDYQLATGLDCTNTSISDYDKAACYATDLTLFYFIGTLLFIAGAIVTAKVIFGD